MSVALKQAAVDEALELSWLFRQNAALRAGLPDVKKTHAKLGDDPPPQPAPPPVVNITNQLPPTAGNSPSPGATVVAAAKSSLLRRAAPWLVATALGSAGLGGLGGWLFSRGQTPVQPEPVTQAEQDRSMLQWLQDKGQHLKPGATWEQQ